RRARPAHFGPPGASPRAGRRRPARPVPLPPDPSPAPADPALTRSSSLPECQMTWVGANLRLLRGGSGGRPPGVAELLRGARGVVPPELQRPSPGVFPDVQPAVSERVTRKRYGP